MSQIDEEVRPDDLGLQLFCSPLADNPDHYTLNVSLFLPRGMDDPSADQTHRVVEYVLDRAERMLPGFRAAMLCPLPQA